MLRRVAPGLRLVLLVAGMLCVTCLPASWFCRAWGFNEATGVWVGVGGCWAGIARTPSDGSFFPSAYTDGYGFEARSGDIEWSRVFRTQVEYDDRGIKGVIFVTVPLWLLAAVCLAWPVTSLLLASRRRKARGFAVEPLSTPLPPGEVPSPRGGEGGHRAT